MAVIVRGPSGPHLHSGTGYKCLQIPAPDHHTHQNGGNEGPSAGYCLARPTPSLPEGTEPGAPARPHRDP